MLRHGADEAMVRLQWSFPWGKRILGNRFSSEIQCRQQTADDAGNQTETDAHVFSSQLDAPWNTKTPEVYLESGVMVTSGELRGQFSLSFSQFGFG